MPPARGQGQVNREASRLGDAGVTDPLPTPRSRKTDGDAAVFSGMTCSGLGQWFPSPKAGCRHVAGACPAADPTAGALVGLFHSVSDQTTHRNESPQASSAVQRGKSDALMI